MHVTSDGGAQRCGVRHTARFATASAPGCTVGAVESGVELADPDEVALAREYIALKERVAEARERTERLRALAEHLDGQARSDEQALRGLEGVLGLSDQLQIDALDRELGGRRLAEIAVAVLQRELQPGQAVHYRDWYALLRRAGYRVRGKDPLASFLAQITRSEQVEPVGRRSGRYRLRAA